MPESNAYGLPVGELLEPAWTPRRRPERVTLSGRYVSVVPLDASYAGRLHAALCGPGDEGLWTYRPTEMPGNPRRPRTSATSWSPTSRR